MGPAIDTREIAREIGARVREELDYVREARLARLYQIMLAGRPLVRIPRIFDALSTRRLLTMQWLDGDGLLEFQDAPAEWRNTIAMALFDAWWLPFSQFGVIHGDPHLGNYSVVARARARGGGSRRSISSTTAACASFPPASSAAWWSSTEACKATRRGWSMPTKSGASRRLSRETVAALNIWARFIYGPLVDDRVRSIADGVKPGEYGRREAFAVARALKAQGPLKVPREFVFMDRAAIGLGGAFLRLRAELNFHRLFEAAIEGFSVEAVAARQSAALSAVGLEAP